VHLVPEEPNSWAWVRVLGHMACLLFYVRFWLNYERVPNGTGKFIVRMLIVPFVAFLLFAVIVALGKATDVAENLQVLLSFPDVIGVGCLIAIERHRRR
jgi:hypothetical protein